MRPLIKYFCPATVSIIMTGTQERKAPAGITGVTLGIKNMVQTGPLFAPSGLPLKSRAAPGKVIVYKINVAKCPIFILKIRENLTV
jgi:hypothetical protein